MLSIFIIACVFSMVSGHGMVLDPVNRASRWREDESAPINVDDNGLFCGGMMVQFGQNGGKCGLCGDNYADPVPRTYEIGGAFGQGNIVKSYKPGDAMFVQVLVTANHLGSFTFNLCNMDKFGGETEECFEDIRLLLINGEESFVINEKVGYFDLALAIPKDLLCEHCVLQWTWTTANSWGDCGDGTGAVGCGKVQETFRTCSDISILP